MLVKNCTFQVCAKVFIFQRKIMHTQNLFEKHRITNELIDEVCEYIKIGAPTIDSARAAGIAPRDFYFWMAEGSSDFHSTACINCDYAMFYDAISTEEAKVRALFFACIQHAALNGDWKASAWWIEYNDSMNPQSESDPQKMDAKTSEMSAEQFHKNCAELERLIDEFIKQRDESLIST